MTNYGLWLIGCCLAYTALLIGASAIARKKFQAAGGYFEGGRTFGRWTIAFCITGLFSGSTYISILELSYASGISAIWYGVAEIVQILIIAFLIIGPFRERFVTTITQLIGDRFGRTAQGIASLITAITFPMWAVATAIAFASAMHVYTEIPLGYCIAFTAFLLFIFLQGGGMWSVALTQTINMAVFGLMFIIALYVLIVTPEWGQWSQAVSNEPSRFSWSGVGIQVIIAWFGTFLVNVILAQAAFQMALSSRSKEESQKGMLYAAGLAIPFITIGVALGVVTALAVPDGGRGFFALPVFLMEVLPAPLVGLFFLGIWACALSWGAPCQFSGATSLGRDFTRALRPNLLEKQTIVYTKISLLILTGLMLIFGLARPEQAAWWNVFAWSIRNGATFAPVVAALFWPLATKRAAIASLLFGGGASLTWYALGHFDVAHFYGGIHPVWIGSIVNMLTLLIGTLIEKRTVIQFQWAIKGWHTYFLGIALVTTILLFTFAYGWLLSSGLLGLVAFLMVLLLFITLMTHTTEQTAVNRWIREEALNE